MAKKAKLRSKLRTFVIRHMPETAKSFLYRKMIQIETDNLPGLELKLARTKEELTAAFRLLHDNYVRSGFMAPHPSGMRLTKYHALPSTSTLIACIDGEVVGTVSLVRNGAFGTPLEAIYDVSDFRKRGSRIVEVSSLAVSQNFSGNHGKILFPLLNYLYHYSEYYFGVDYLAIAVNPLWWDFYRHILLFEKLKDAKVANYDFVNGAPAVGGVLDLSTARERYEAAYGHRGPKQNLFEFLGNLRLPGAVYPARTFGVVSDPVMTPELLDHFFREKSDVFAKLSEAERLALWCHYDDPRFRMILPRPTDGNSPLGLRKAGPRHDIQAPVKVKINDGRTIVGALKNVNSMGAMLISDRGFRKDEEVTVDIAITVDQSCEVQFCVAWSTANGVTGLRLTHESASFQTFVAGLDRALLKAG